jgi:hypothetical protein
MGINEQKKTVKIPKFEKGTSSSDSNSSGSSESGSSQSESPRKIVFSVPLAVMLLVLISMIVAVTMNPGLISFIAGQPSAKSQTNAP